MAKCDVSDETRASRKTVRDIAALAKQQGVNNLKIHGDGLIVGTNKYRHDELDLLPHQSEKSETKKRGFVSKGNIALIRTFTGHVFRTNKARPMNAWSKRSSTKRP